MEEAIQKEQETAKKLLQEQSQLHEKKIAELNAVKLAELNQKLEELQKKVTTEYEQLIVIHVEKVINEKTLEIQKIVEGYENELAEAEDRFQLKLSEMKELNVRIAELENYIGQLKEVIDDVRDEYQNCIAHFAHLKKKEADFLFPMQEKRKLTY